MEFSTNHPILFLLAGILVAVVLAQSVYFLLKALRRSKEIGMDQAKIKKTIKTAADRCNKNDSQSAVSKKNGTKTYPPPMTEAATALMGLNLLRNKNADRYRHKKSTQKFVRNNTSA